MGGGDKAMRVSIEGPENLKNIINNWPWKAKKTRCSDQW